MEATPGANYALRVRKAPGGNGNFRKGLRVGGGKRNVILVGDIGGTHTRLAIIDRVKEQFNFPAEETFSSREEILN
jgi:hypothetical protein